MLFQNLQNYKETKKEMRFKILFLLLLLFQNNFAYKPNLLFNLSKVEENGELTIASYKIITIEAVFPTPIIKMDNSSYKHCAGPNLQSKVITATFEFLTLNIGGQVKSLNMTLIRSLNNICKHTITAYKIDIDEILNENV